MREGILADLHHYPIRGLSPQRLSMVEVLPGRGFAQDRSWALARHDGEAQHRPDQPLGSKQYHGPTFDPRLVGVRTHLDPESEELTVWVREHVVLTASLRAESGRTEAEELFARVLDLDPEHRPRLIRRTGGDYSFSYTAWSSASLRAAVHVVNLASVRDFKERIGSEVDPLRFRANLYIDMGEPWVEQNWMNSRFGAGEAVFSVERACTRCAATEVNPDDAKPDIPIPRLLKQHYGHVEMGFYANVLQGGVLEPGLTVRPFVNAPTVDAG